MAKKKPEKLITPNPVGRPSKYKPEYCSLLIEHMAQGYSFESFAAVIKVNRDSLYEWEKVYSDFSDAKKEALDQCLLFWEGLGIKNIINFPEMGSLNSAVWVFNMKNRFKWRDKQPDESDVVVNNVSNLNDDELDKKISDKLNSIKKK